MTALSMSGHIDLNFNMPEGVVRVVVQTTFDPDTGRMVEREVKRFAVRASVLPVSPREISTLPIGNERYTDYRRIYINSGDFSFYDLRGYFELFGAKWKPLSIDRRDSRKYCKYVVARLDE